MKRPILTNKAFIEVDNCKFEFNGTKTHPYYLETGYKVDEYTVLK